MGGTIKVLTQHSETLTMEPVGATDILGEVRGEKQTQIRFHLHRKFNKDNDRNGYICILCIMLTLLSQHSFQKAWWTFNLVASVVITSRNQSGPGEDARPTAIAFPSSCCSIHHGTKFTMKLFPGKLE